MTAIRPRIPWRVVAATADALVGRPYALGARGPAAYDCWGLVLEARRQLGLPLPPDFASATLDPVAIDALFHHARPSNWRRVELTMGGVMLAPDGGHAGVHLAGRVLHANRRAGVVAWPLAWWSAFVGEPECWDLSEGGA
jgi:cell wall-associated NlpC family hydrolase